MYPGVWEYKKSLVLFRFMAWNTRCDEICSFFSRVPWFKPQPPPLSLSLRKNSKNTLKMPLEPILTLVFFILVLNCRSKEGLGRQIKLKS